jgi:hypothetical protein
MSHRIIVLRKVQGDSLDRRSSWTDQMKIRGRFVKTTVGLTSFIIRNSFKCNISQRRYLVDFRIVIFTIKEYERLNASQFATNRFRTSGFRIRYRTKISSGSDRYIPILGKIGVQNSKFGWKGLR